MNSDQIKGKAKEILGEVQEHAGRIVGSKTQEAKGHATEVEGKVQKAAGDLRQSVKDGLNDASKSL